ncbi:MAG TPA: VOC family protein [Ktedonobacteraceae bacterium]|nr:VOC family protein [Ktedonobacteraceae bacterium]
MSTKMTKLTPEIVVENVQETLAFYQEILGFQVIATVPEGARPYAWAMVKNEGVELMIESRESAGAGLPMLQGKEIGGTFSFYIDVNSVDAVLEHIKDRVRVVQNMHITPYGAKEFAILDNNGFILVFAEHA